MEVAQASQQPRFGLADNAPFTRLGWRAGKCAAGTETRCLLTEKQSCVPGEAIRSTKHDSSETQPRDPVNLMSGHEVCKSSG